MLVVHIIWPFQSFIGFIWEVFLFGEGGGVSKTHRYINTSSNSHFFGILYHHNLAHLFGVPWTFIILKSDFYVRTGRCVTCVSGAKSIWPSTECLPVKWITSARWRKKTNREMKRCRERERENMPHKSHIKALKLFFRKIRQSWFYFFSSFCSFFFVSCWPNPWTPLRHQTSNEIKA